MKFLTCKLVLALGMALGCTSALTAQSAEAEQARAAEEMAREFEERAKEWGAQIEKWAAEHEEEIEEWAEKYARQWEEWAEGFEDKWEQWAADQEMVWQDWAERYSERWEQWGEQLESGELSPDQLSELIQRNLKMLGDMPLGEMIDGALKEGLSELEDAPWEGIGELQELIRDSLEQSLKGMEELTADNELDGTELEQRAKEMKKALSKLQSELDSKQAKLDKEVNSKLEALREALQSGNIDDADRREQVEKLIEAMRIAEDRQKTIADRVRAAKARAEAAKKQAEMRKKAGGIADWAKKLKAEELDAKRAIERAKKARSEAERAQGKAKAAAIADAIKKKEKSRELKAIEEFLKATQETRDKGDSALSAEILKKVYSELAKERDTIRLKESQLDTLRREIEELRKEVQRLKKEKRDK